MAGGQASRNDIDLPDAILMYYLYPFSLFTPSRLPLCSSVCLSVGVSQPNVTYDVLLELPITIPNV